MIEKRKIGPTTRKGIRPVSGEDRAVYAAYLQGESYSAIARRLRRSPAWVTLAVERAHVEVRETRLKANGA
jgi:hypothetical protein